MSVISKDELIVSCADAVRDVMGTSEGIKAGELAEKIKALTGGAKLLEAGSVTAAANITSAVRALKINLSELPDLFVLRITAEDAETVEGKLGAVVAGVCFNVPALADFLPFDDDLTNANRIILRQSGGDEFVSVFGANNLTVNESSGGALVRFYGSSATPIRIGTYVWESYRLWKEASI